MGQLSDRRLLVRWAFLGMGYFLLFGRFFIYNWLLFANIWADVLFGGGTRGILLARVVARLYMLAASLLCFAANSGLRRNQWWGYWAGMAACILSLPWFPFMTVLGVAGMYALSTISGASASASPLDSTFGFDASAARRSKDYWVSKSQSRLQPVIVGTLSIAALFSLSFCQIWAYRARMPLMPRGLIFWFWFSVFLLFSVIIHESGHAVVAWSLYYRVRVISMGPITFWRDSSSGIRSRFDWRRLFYSGGYTGSVATRQENARWKHVAVIAAGPAASLLGGLVFAVATVLSRGTSWQAWWWVFATNAMIGFLNTIVNLIPIGYSDGSMLLQLIRWAAPGRVLIAQQFAAAEEQKAKACHGEADFAGEIEIKRTLLAQAESAGDINAMAIAACHRALGYALHSAGDWPAAERELCRAIAFEAEVAADPTLAAGIWAGLVSVRARRMRIAEMEEAYKIAVRVVGRTKGSRDPVRRGIACGVLAQVHAAAGRWDEAAAQAAEGLKLVPLRPEYLNVYANLFIAQAEAHLQAGHMDAGLTAASNAAETLRAAVMPAAKRNLAASDLGALGEALWRAGQPAWAIDYLRESIAALDRSGVTTAAAAHRIQLCGILRTLGRYSEAVKSLPPEDGLPPHLRRNLLTETVELALLAEAGAVALEHCQTLVQLWQAEGSDCAPESALAESLLARAYLVSGDPEKAQAYSQSALTVLEAIGHPEAARCLLTIAASRHAVAGVWPAEILDHARRLIEQAVLLPRVERDGLLELARRDSTSQSSTVVASVGE